MKMLFLLWGSLDVLLIIALVAFPNALVWTLYGADLLLFMHLTTVEALFLILQLCFGIWAILKKLKEK